MMKIPTAEDIKTEAAKYSMVYYQDKDSTLFWIFLPEDGSSLVSVKRNGMWIPAIDADVSTFPPMRRELIELTEHEKTYEAYCKQEACTGMSEGDAKILVENDECSMIETKNGVTVYFYKPKASA